MAMAYVAVSFVVTMLMMQPWQGNNHPHALFGPWQSLFMLFLIWPHTPLNPSISGSITAAGLAGYIGYLLLVVIGYVVFKRAIFHRWFKAS